MSPVSANTDLMTVGVITAETPASSRALSGASSIAQREVRECGGIEPLRGDKALNRCEDICGQKRSFQFVYCVQTPEAVSVPTRNNRDERRNSDATTLVNNRKDVGTLTAVNISFASVLRYLLGVYLCGEKFSLMH